jgi:hypothetical protein
MEKSLMTARLFFNAAFPVMKVVLADDPAMKEKFKNVKATVQIGAKNGSELEACTLKFDNGELEIIASAAEKPDIALTFSSLDKMNTMFSGGMALPAIKGLNKPGLLLKVMSMLMSLKLMLPSSKPADPAKKALKLKMSLYMITRALSTYNKLGDPDMKAWTSSQPDRIYQFVVNGSDIACYLRVKAGNTKSGHGVYQRRTPFVLFNFKSVDGALKVLLKEVGFVEGVEQGCIEIVGSPEYASTLNDFMAILQGMMVGG